MIKQVFSKKMAVSKKICVAIYNHPELFPPTLNAVDYLSNQGWEVDLIYNNQFPSTWNYANNVHLFPIGKMAFQKELETSNIFQKILRWLQFVRLLRRLIKECNICLVYDPMPLLAYHVASLFQKKKNKLLWYHNHDVYELDRTRKYSLQWFATIAEQRWFNRINIFTLPAIERELFFPLETFKGHKYVIPNFPSLSTYAKLENKFEATKNIRILFQGTISQNHGIEEFLELLPLKVNDRNIEIVLVGSINPGYEQKLLEICRTKNIENYLTLIRWTPYRKLAEITVSCTVGLAVFTAHDVMNSSLGTASNKIYEYAACGLPIIYFDNPHFRYHLAKYPWAFGTDLSPKSIINVLDLIVNNYTELSKSAKIDFISNLNFEKVFQTPFELMQLMLNQSNHE